MYFYLVNPAAGGQRLENVESRLKNRLEKFDINNHFHKILSDKDIPKLVTQAIENDHKTIVVIGNDETVNQTITALHDNHGRQAVGIIPIGKDNILAKQLGIRNWRHACNLLASRRLAHFHFLMVNDQVFLHKLLLRKTGSKNQLPKSKWGKLFQTTKLQDFSCKINIESDYEIRGDATKITIKNQKMHDQNLSNKLHLKLQHSSTHNWRKVMPFWSTPTQSSQFFAEEAVIKTKEPITAVLDGVEKNGNHFQIELTNETIPIITGKATKASS